MVFDHSGIVELRRFRLIDKPFVFVPRPHNVGFTIIRMADRYTQIVAAVAVVVTGVKRFGIPVRIMELIRRKLGFVKELGLFQVVKIIVVIDIYRFLVVEE